MWAHLDARAEGGSLRQRACRCRCRSPRSDAEQACSTPPAQLVLKRPDLRHSRNAAGQSQRARFDPQYPSRYGYVTEGPPVHDTWPTIRWESPVRNSCFQLASTGGSLTFSPQLEPGRPAACATTLSRLRDVRHGEYEGPADHEQPESEERGTDREVEKPYGGRALVEQSRPDDTAHEPRHQPNSPGRPRQGQRPAAIWAHGSDAARSGGRQGSPWGCPSGPGSMGQTEGQTSQVPP